MKEKVDITGMTWQEVVALVNCSKTTAKNALKHGYYVVNFKKRTCFTCADNLGCNLEPRCESMDGCIKSTGNNKIVSRKTGVIPGRFAAQGLRFIDYAIHLGI